jgi:hypothetical protein
MKMTTIIIIIFYPFPVNGAPVEWNWQGKSEVLGEKPVPVTLCPPQIPHGLIRDRTRASVAEGRRLTAWAMARLFHTLKFVQRLKPFACGTCPSPRVKTLIMKINATLLFGKWFGPLSRSKNTVKILLGLASRQNYSQLQQFLTRNVAEMHWSCHGGFIFPSGKSVLPNLNSKSVRNFFNRRNYKLLWKYIERRVFK